MNKAIGEHALTRLEICSFIKQIDIRQIFKLVY
jgi:hypothetical protein